MRLLTLVYGFTAYLVGLSGLTYFFLFMGGWSFLPVHIDSGDSGNPLTALLINLGLILLFAVQHSFMARDGFKQALKKLLPAAAERSTYVLLSGAVTWLICLCWQPFAGTVWNIENEILQVVLVALQLLGWATAVASTFAINHFDLMGLQQVYLNYTRRPEPSPRFAERFMYRVVRHPIQLGILVGMWSTPWMSLTHLLLSASMTCYILVGLYFEERDLVAALGDDYRQYRRRVPKLIPLPRLKN